MNFNIIYNYRITHIIFSEEIISFFQKHQPFVDTGIYALFKKSLMVFWLSKACV
jgi:hypothetical protein